MAETGMNAIIKAIEASIAWYHDPVAQDPEWSINPERFWKTLVEEGYELAPYTPGTRWTGQMTCARCGREWSVGSHILGSTTHVCPTQGDGSDVSG